MNVCTFTGNISRKGDLKNSNGVILTKFTVAVNRKSKDGGTDFVGFTAFGKTAEFVDNWCKVGTKVCVRSHYQLGSYINKDGKKTFTHDFIVDELEKMTSKADDNAESKEHPKQEYTQKEFYDFEPIADGLEDVGLPFN